MEEIARSFLPPKFDSFQNLNEMLGWLRTVDSDAQESSDEEKSEKQIMRERVFGERKSARAAQPRQSFGYVLNTEQLKFS